MDSQDLLTKTQTISAGLDFPVLFRSLKWDFTFIQVSLLFYTDIFERRLGTLIKCVKQESHIIKRDDRDLLYFAQLSKDVSYTLT